MAKELPYFKFEPSQWDTGNIQLCSFEAQGVFINLCSMYWQRLGNLPYKLAVQKICNGNATALDSLCEEDVIKVIDGHICIDFLNEQLSEFENLSKVNSENARSGWIKRKKKPIKNATVMRPHSDRNAIRGEEIREDERYYTNAQIAFEDISNNYLETEPQRNVLSNRGWKSVTKADTDALLYHFLDSQVDLKIQEKSDVKSHFKKWLNKRPLEELQPLVKKIHERFQTKVS